VSLADLASRIALVLLRELLEAGVRLVADSSEAPRASRPPSSGEPSTAPAAGGPLQSGERSTDAPAPEAAGPTPSASGNTAGATDAQQLLELLGGSVAEALGYRPANEPVVFDGARRHFTDPLDADLSEREHP
jgi:hypothetical protein